MNQQIQQKVEFFQSQSSFGSQSSLSNSRYYDFTNEIIAQTDNIILSLRKQLLPNESLSHPQKIKHIMNRAQILYKDTIPQHTSYLRKIKAEANAQQQVKNCQNKLKRLLSDYQSYRADSMSYKQFFNLYGRQPGKFQKKQKALVIESDQLIKPDHIQITYNDKAKLKATPRIAMPQNNVQGSSDKQTLKLKQQLLNMKLILQQNKRKYEQSLAEQRMNSEKRFKVYLSAHPELINSDLARYNENNIRLQQQNQYLKKQLIVLKKQIQKKQQEKKSLQQQTQQLRKINFNLQEQNNINDKSYASQINQKDDRKLQKKIKYLTQENQLLKNQLNVQRKRNQKSKNQFIQEIERQNQRLKDQIIRKNKQIQQMHNDIDKQRIQVIQLRHNNITSSRLHSQIKKQNDQLRIKVDTISKKQSKSSALSSIGSSQSIPLGISRRIIIKQYQGEGIQGLSYYQLLTRQFKLRFRRACLRQKQLLYNANGLQIGAITTFQQPNKIDIKLHVTNYNDIKITKMKGRVMNANQNKIVGQIFEFAQITPGQQIKIPLSLIITHYPLGPLILVVDYQTNKKQQIRIILPAHIFKMIQFQPRNTPLKKSQNINIALDKKIAKQFKELSNYFKGINFNENKINILGYHRHSHTQIYFDIQNKGDNININYQHYQGNINITNYFIRALTFLLQKTH